MGEGTLCPIPYFHIMNNFLLGAAKVTNLSYFHDLQGGYRDLT